MTGTEGAPLALNIGTIIVGRRNGGGVLPAQTKDGRAFASSETKLHRAVKSRGANDVASMVKVKALSCRTAK